MISEAENRLADFRTLFEQAYSEIGKVIVGQKSSVESILVCLLAGGHVLLEGIPGLGKTKLVQTLGDVLHLDFDRIQFTPDLMPGDIIGTNILQEDEHGERTLMFRPGPIFAHLILADEINRATPKTQSALLEAMQERTVSVGRTSHTLDEPFFVMATQNPLEMEGTYPLPEAQLDRFFMKLKMTYPTREDLHEILGRTTSAETPEARAVLSREQVLEMRRTTRSVPISREVTDYAIRLALATQPDDPTAPDLVKRYGRMGTSPRGAQALVLAGKVRALLHDRAHVACDDVREQALSTLRHRVLLNFEGEAEGIDTDDLLLQVLETVPEA